MMEKRKYKKPGFKSEKMFEKTVLACQKNTAEQCDGVGFIS